MEKKKEKVKSYHASPQSTLVTDAFLTSPTENTELLMVILASAEKQLNNKRQTHQTERSFLGNISLIKMFI